MRTFIISITLFAFSSFLLALNENPSNVTRMNPALGNIPPVVPAFLYQESPLLFDFNFQTGFEGWQGAFVDYPPGQEASLELIFDWRDLPPYLAPDRKALYLSGSNHCDDLFMFLKYGLTGLKPYTLYQLVFIVDIATNAPSDCGGIGGPPGTGVTLKAGAAAIEPVGVVSSGGDGWVRLNIDKGNQVSGGWDAIPLGHIGNTRHCPDTTYEFKTLSNSASLFQAVTDAYGRLWVLAGTDSGFEGTTSLFYSHVMLELEEVGIAGDLNLNGKIEAADLVILKHYLAGNLLPGQPPFLAVIKAADVNGQQGISPEDIELLAEMLAGQ